MADTVTARVEHRRSGRIGPKVCHRIEERDCASVLVLGVVGQAGLTREGMGAGVMGEEVARVAMAEVWLAG